MDANSVWQALGGGALIAAVLTITRMLLETTLRGADRRTDRDERGRHQQRDAEARLERLLHDRLADADRRLERSEFDLHAERIRSAMLEHEHARLQQAHDLLTGQYALLLAEQARLVHPAALQRPQTSASSVSTPRTRPARTQ